MSNELAANSAEKSEAYIRAEKAIQQEEVLAYPTAQDRRVIWLLRICSSVSVVFVGIILILGICTLAYGVFMFAGIEFKVGKLLAGCWGGFVESDTPDPYKAISILISALEYFLLAPLCYLQLRTIADYMYGLLVYDKEKKKKSYSESPMEIKKKEMLSVKGLSVGLLIMILATNMIGDFLKSSLYETDFQWIKLVCGIGLLSALTVYFHVIEKFSK